MASWEQLQCERPRDRLLLRGVNALSERELLAVVLGCGWHGRSALELATDLLATYGSLATLAAAAPEDLARQPGVGSAKSAALLAAFRLGHLAMTEPPEGKELAGPKDIFTVAQRELGGLRREHVLVVVCDSRNRVHRLEVIAKGSVDRSVIPIREVLNCVLIHDGRAFALAHNHPSGDPTPSDADVEATRDLRAAAKTIGLRFLDHVVVTANGWARAG